MLEVAQQKWSCLLLIVKVLAKKNIIEFWKDCCKKNTFVGLRNEFSKSGAPLKNSEYF